ncbi:MAG: endonuclease MutS2 [Candidatus Cloacimonas sp.]|jgi:DNA mismatch repair protein MutS2|nr:endonuclease MutS2 [Candidatus Cloacimonas sp.]
MAYSNPDLEYETLCAQLSKRCHSALGAALADALQPLSELAEIRKSQKLVAEIQELLGHGLDFNFEPLNDLTALFEDSRNSLFGFEEFSAIFRNNSISDEVLSRAEAAHDFPLLKYLLSGLTAFTELNRRFTEIFDYEGEILDTASPQLAAIRKRTMAVRMRIQKTMQSLLSDNRFERFLQDKFVTQREDRYVLPIKESSVPFVDGIVQSHSGSKATVFVEPALIVPMNNELQMVKQEEKQEIFRIFSTYTAQIKASQKQIMRNQSLLARLDFRFACGRLCLAMDAKVPIMLAKAAINLQSARHPLLILRLGTPAKVIPFDLELGNEHRIVILSGPNTGGKTVLMKAVGLIALMALSGLPVPAASDSEIGMFSAVYADIGDDQSIENALSTFSSHLDKIGKMLHAANESTLILIDEIGAATDPQQGSALAQAILERFADMGCPGIVTTHYTSLKIFGEHHGNCVNASMQFDLKSLHPTYRFVPGFPGDSFAIEVAASLGIEPALIERAKSLSGSQNQDFTSLLKKMQEEKKQLSVQSYQFELKTRNLAAKIQELESKEAIWEEELKKRRQNHLKELQKELIAQQKIYAAELNELKSLEKTERKALSERKLHAIGVKTAELQQELIDSGIATHQALANPKPGDRVWLANFDTEAIIIAIQGESATVDMNGISFKTPLEFLYAAKPKTEEAKSQIFVRSTASPKARMELKLLGLTFDEAMPMIDEFLDDAALSGLHTLRIVHGKGTGALRSKVRSYLQRKKGIINIDTPPMNQGGSGVTIVKL